jgi:hypothetical protein
MSGVLTHIETPAEPLGSQAQPGQFVDNGELGASVRELDDYVHARYGGAM